MNKYRSEVWEVLNPGTMQGMGKFAFRVYVGEKCIVDSRDFEYQGEDGRGNTYPSFEAADSACNRCVQRLLEREQAT